MTRSGVRAVVSTLLVAAGLLCISVQSAGASPGAWQILFANGVDGSCEGDTGLETQLAAMPGVANVDAFNASTGTPSVAQMVPYDLIVAHSDCDAFSNATALGNNLADYVDQGGVVVEYAYTMENASPYQLTGRWQSGGYSPYLPANNVNNDVVLGDFDAASPLMAGVNDLTSEGCNTDPALALGATSIAQWDNGQEAVAFKGHVVAVTASIDDSGCPWSGDYARLTLNAVTVFGKPAVPVTPVAPPSGSAISKAKINRKKHTAKFLFSAAGTVTGFECALSRSKKKGKKSKAAAFSACSSPKLYKHLKNGRYRFQVRGLNSSGPDPQPATRKFKI